MRAALALPFLILASAVPHQRAPVQAKDDKKVAEKVGLAIEGLASEDPASRSKNAAALQSLGDVRGLRALHDALNFEDNEKVRKVLTGAIESILKATTTFEENSVSFKVTGTKVILSKDGNVDVRGACPGGTGSISTGFESLRSLKTYCKGKTIPPGRVEILKAWLIEVAIPYLMKYDRPDFYTRGKPVIFLTEGAPMVTLSRTPSADSAEVELYANGALVFYKDNGKGMKVCADLQKLKDALDQENYSEEEKGWFEKKAYPKLKEMSEKQRPPK